MDLVIIRPSYNKTPNTDYYKKRFLLLYKKYILSHEKWLSRLKLIDE